MYLTNKRKIICFGKYNNKKSSFFLGEDFKYLSEEEEVSSHKLYTKLNSKESFEDEDNELESELKYLKVIRDIRDTDEELFEKIKKLPKKSKSGRIYKDINKDKTISFIKKGSLKKFFMADSEDAEELYFLQAIKYLESQASEKRMKVPKDYFNHLELNKLQFEIALTEEEEIVVGKASKSTNDSKVIKILKAIRRNKTFTDGEEDLIKQMISTWRMVIYLLAFQKKY